MTPTPTPTPTPLEDYQQTVAGADRTRGWARDTGAERVVIVSNDSHVGPPIEAFRGYCPRRHLDDFDAFAKERAHNRTSTLSFEDVAAESLMAMGTLAGTSGIHDDPDTRLLHMDEDGVTCEVIYHGSQNGAEIPFVNSAFDAEPSGRGRRGGELAAAGMRMYNRWLADHCSVAPDRLVGLAHLPMWDVELAVRELELAHEAGLRGVNFPAPRATLAPFNDLAWEPLWDACAALDMPLNSHGGNTEAMFDLGSYHGPGAIQIFMLEATNFSRRAVPFMIFGGVFDRHPRLKLILTEQAPAWWHQMVRDLDGFVGAKVYKPMKMAKRPSEYFWSNVFLGTSFMSNAEARAVVEDGTAGNVMWGRDYPHIEGTWPYTKYSIRTAMEGIPADAVRRILGLNAIEIHGLDLDALRPIADRIGPGIDEIMTPIRPDELPAGTCFSSGFRDASNGFFG